MNGVQCSRRRRRRRQSPLRALQSTPCRQKTDQIRFPTSSAVLGAALKLATRSLRMKRLVPPPKAISLSHFAFTRIHLGHGNNICASHLYFPRSLRLAISPPLFCFDSELPVSRSFHLITCAFTFRQPACIHRPQLRADKSDIIETVQDSLVSYASSALAGAIGDEEQASCGMAAFIRLLEADVAISKTLPRVCECVREHAFRVCKDHFWTCLVDF